MKTTLQGALSGLLLVMLSLLSAGRVAGDEPARIAIVPFKINAEKDLSFLREGIVDMLTSRLSWEGCIVVERGKVDRALRDLSLPLNEKTARTIGTNLEADYVLFGSLTIFGKSVSLDAKLADVHEERETLAYFYQSTKIDDVIPHINLFAAEMNEKLFGRTIAVRRPPAQPQPEEHPGIYTHPEKLLAGTQDAEGPGVSPGFERVEGTIPEMTSTDAWKSRNFKFKINGLGLGDVNGDGATEVVFITDRRLHIYRFENGRLRKIDEFEGKRYQRFIGVDAADINNNGRAEIFVTSLSGSGQVLDSFVLELEGDTFSSICEDEPWYYRVVRMPDSGNVLVGQKRTMDDPFVLGAFRLAWQGERYDSEGRISLPEGVNIFGYAVGRATDSGKEIVVAFDEEDHIRLFSMSGQEVWKSEEAYGGSMNYLELGGQTGRGDTSERFYLPQRIYVQDVNGDGKDDVVVTSNEGTLGRLFATYRRFSGGRMVVFSQSGHGLEKTLQTPKVLGYISDFAIADLDADGKEEVVVAEVRSKGTLVTHGKSTIIAYDLGQQRASGP